MLTEDVPAKKLKSVKRHAAKSDAATRPKSRGRNLSATDPLWKGYFPHSLARALNLLNLQLLHWLRPEGATIQQFRVMQVITALGVASIGEIAQDAIIEQPVVSRIVDQLEARGFAMRQKRPQNGRIVEVRLTPAGLKMYRSVLPHALAIVDEAVTVLSVGERETIELLLTRICRHLQENSRRHENG